VRSSFAKSFGQDETDAQLLHCSIAKDKTKISLTIEQLNNQTIEPWVGQYLHWRTDPV
jgi:hypothetical protein